MTRIPRKNAISLSDALMEALRANHMTTGLNTRLIFSAWDQASGAQAYTVRKYFRSGKLYITVNSSVVRSQLLFQKDVLLEKINAIISKNELFSSEDMNVGRVNELIIK